MTVPSAAFSWWTPCPLTRWWSTTRCECCLARASAFTASESIFVVNGVCVRTGRRRQGGAQGVLPDAVPRLDAGPMERRHRRLSRQGVLAHSEELVSGVHHEVPRVQGSAQVRELCVCARRRRHVRLRIRRSEWSLSVWTACRCSISCGLLVQDRVRRPGHGVAEHHGPA